MPEYIVWVRDDRVALIGPFATLEALSAYERSANRDEDDPRWQSVTLSDPPDPVSVVAPQDPTPSEWPKELYE